MISNTTTTNITAKDSDVDANNTLEKSGFDNDNRIDTSDGKENGNDGDNGDNAQNRDLRNEVNNKIDTLLEDLDLGMSDENINDNNNNNNNSNDNDNIMNTINEINESEYEWISEYEETTEYMVVSVKPNGNNLFDLTKFNTIKLKDLNTVYPSIELNGNDEYVGKYHTCLGYQMFFKHQMNDSNEQHDSNKSEMELVGFNNKTLELTKWNPKFESM